MASETKISIKDRDTAMAWLREIEGLNMDYQTAMTEAGETIVDMENFAEGTMVDELVDCGSKILTAAKSTYEAINAIGGTVVQVLDVVTEFASGAIGLFTKVAGIFGA